MRVSHGVVARVPRCHVTLGCDIDSFPVITRRPATAVPTSGLVPTPAARVFSPFNPTHINGIRELFNTHNRFFRGTIKRFLKAALISPFVVELGEWFHRWWIRHGARLESTENFRTTIVVANTLRSRLVAFTLLRQYSRGGGGGIAA